MLDACSYERVDEHGNLVVDRKGDEMVLEADTIVVCAGQEPLAELAGALEAAGGVKVFKIGGAEAAGELDAQRAIDQGTRLAAAIEDAHSGDVFARAVPLSGTLYEYLGPKPQ
mmetsp:Transcript_25485/g.88905  ORF Transcript_25485/g.88905 Transcript_25485/m.88905 type:complete len:113 (-) Transcript_25485:45-383(-)